ncbi:MAG TPA: substrate-binding domain-containing protein, partial [Anaerolineales bacterium]|nr:substrate-binding domain-containing protein [Anaerolineales bacterium]
QKAIDDLGYRPNVLARSLINQRTNTLAAVAWGIDYFGPSRTVIGIEQQSDELGYSLLLSLVQEPQYHDHQRILDTLLSRRVDGIIWAVPEVGENHNWLTQEQMRQLPPIVFLSTGAIPGLMIVSVDNQAGARQAVQHMISQGRKRIGMLTGPLAWWEARERREGWRTAMREAGLEAPDSLTVECHWSAAEGRRAMHELLERAPDIDGVFAASDQIGLGALDALASAGRRVPADVALVGFDDIPEAPYFRPPLTTVHQKLGEVGRSAVRQLHEVIGLGAAGRRQGEAAVTMIAPELIVRASSA